MVKEDPHQERGGAMGRWLRPASPIECRFEAGHRNRCLLVSYCCSFSASRLISEKEARMALTALYRTSANMRVCLGYRKGQLWLREMHQEKIDFQMIEGGNVQQMYEDMFNKQYNTANGPLWTSRLISRSPSHPETEFPESIKIFPQEGVNEKKYDYNNGNFEDASRETKGRTHISDASNKSATNGLSSAIMNNTVSKADAISNLDTQHPYKYHLLLGFNHLIADGYTCFRVFGLVMKLLNSILAGQKIDDKTQTASVVDPTNELEMMTDIERSLRSETISLQRKRVELEERASQKPLFLEAYPPPLEETWRTANLVHHFDEDITRSFISRCKKEGVTFHSGFSRVIEAATVQMLQAAGMDKESYDITNVHIVDHRRYNGNVNNSFGTCIGYINSSDSFSKSSLDLFWEGVKNQDVSLKDQISCRSSLENDVVNRLLRPDNFTFDEFFQSPPYPSSYFTTSNMLDITDIIGDCGDHVRVDWLHGGTSNHRTGNICVHIFQTLRGRLQYGINYSTQYLHTNTARALGQTVSRVLRRVIRF